MVSGIRWLCVVVLALLGFVERQHFRPEGKTPCGLVWLWEAPVGGWWFDCAGPCPENDPCGFAVAYMGAGEIHWCECAGDVPAGKRCHAEITVFSPGAFPYVTVPDFVVEVRCTSTGCDYSCVLPGAGGAWGRPPWWYLGEGAREALDGRPICGCPGDGR